MIEKEKGSKVLAKTGKNASGMGVTAACNLHEGKGCVYSVLFIHSSMHKYQGKGALP